MALLTRQNASGPTGAEITFASATSGAGGDTLVGGQGVHLLVRNGSGSLLTGTLVTPETIEGSLAVEDRAFTVTAGAQREVPVPSRYNDPATGLAKVTWDAVTTVTVAAVQGSVTP